jgi:phage terminase small subunit
MPAIKNQRQEQFAQALAKGMTADAAYAEAGYKRNRGNAARLKAKESIKARIAELQQKTTEIVLKRMSITKQYVIEALLENIEKSLARQPVRVGPGGVEMFAYRGEVANNAIKLAGLEIGLFVNKGEVAHRADRFADLTDTELLLRIKEGAEALLLEHQATPEDG